MKCNISMEIFWIHCGHCGIYILLLNFYRMGPFYWRHPHVLYLSVFRAPVFVDSSWIYFFKKHERNCVVKTMWTSYLTFPLVSEIAAQHIPNSISKYNSLKDALYFPRYPFLYISFLLWCIRNLTYPSRSQFLLTHRS